MTPSLAQLAEAVCCSKSTAAAALEHLEFYGWVDRKRSKGGRSRKTTYQLQEGFACGPQCDYYRRPPSLRAKPRRAGFMMLPRRGDGLRPEHTSSQQLICWRRRWRLLSHLGP